MAQDKTPELEGVRWDETAPEGPPPEATPPRPVPRWLVRALPFMQTVVAGESFLLDLCLERAMEIVAWNIRNRTAGGDHFTGGAEQNTPVAQAAIAGPLAVELYKQSLDAIRARADEFKKLVEGADDKPDAPPQIIAAGA